MNENTFLQKKNAKQYIYGDLEILSDESNKKYFDEEDYNEGQI